jgi:hypothetical protein
MKLALELKVPKKKKKKKKNRPGVFEFALI